MGRVVQDAMLPPQFAPLEHAGPLGDDLVVHSRQDLLSVVGVDEADPADDVGWIAQRSRAPFDFDIEEIGGRPVAESAVDR